MYGLPLNLLYARRGSLSDRCPGACAHAILKRDTCADILRKGDDPVGNSHRAQGHQFELLELILLFKTNNSLSSDSSRQYLSQQYPPALLHTHAGEHAGALAPLLPTTIAQTDRSPRESQRVLADVSLLHGVGMCNVIIYCDISVSHVILLRM